MREITQHLRATHQGERFELVQEWAVRVGDLQAALLRHRPDIVHFSGHGLSERTGSPSSADTREMLPAEEDRDGEILVEDEAGRAKPIPASALADLFGIVGGVRCVVLNACWSGAQADAIRRHVPHVIGTRAEILDEAALAFSAGFYKAIGAGKDVPFAFEAGKARVHMEGCGGEDLLVLL